MEEIASLTQAIPQMSGSAELRGYCDGVGATIGALLDGGTRVSSIGRMATAAYDALQARLLRDAEAELGPPPCAYAWLVLGSAGRCEQTLRTDQDNALVYADGAPPTAAAYFTALADRVVEHLVECGFPRCPGEIMATNPQWRQSLQTWQRYFQRWIMTPDAEALLRVSIFFDYRQIHGALDVEATLRPTLLRARDEHTFLAYLAHAAVRQPAPIGMFGRLIGERRGHHHDLIDLKLRGTALIVDLARLFGLGVGSRATNTLDRLRDAATGGSLSRVGADDLATAFEQIMLLRTRHQYDLIQRGAPPGNDMPIGQLSPQERRKLRSALRAVARIQRSVVYSFQTAWFG